ncbi:MAG TPA: hypothetical protein VEU54_00215 [Steroidobacteraceae bacterium]|jgi:hypothetical protein|nr:hypothetical protein [Steroidobacteraceae bacterium]
MKRIASLMLAATALASGSAAFAAQTGPAATPDPAAPAAMGAPAQPSGTRLAALVPPGMSTQEACNGFKDIRECSAALHAAQNLNIPFADLKGKVAAGESLSAAIHSLKPEADARTEVRKAEKQASEDLSAPQG